MENKSQVELFFYAIAAKMNSRRQWSDLNFMEQQAFVQSINTILQVIAVDVEQEQNYE